MCVTVDLCMFMGQSNMAGRGNASESIVCSKEAGFEYRAISSPDCLCEVKEPFGIYENNEEGVSENRKTGSLVSAFINEYYKNTNVPLVGVSCSKGGTSIAWWQPEKKPLKDAVQRLNSAREYLKNNGYRLRHCFMLWCQGETDGDKHTPIDLYKLRTVKMVEYMLKAGIERCFLIRIGNKRSDESYAPYQRAQEELCRENKDIVLVSEKFAELRTMMKDEYHYIQEAYNIVGEEAGRRTAEAYMQL